MIATGSRVPRDLPVPGRELEGVHFAMEYLYVRNRAVAANGGAPGAISAAGKHVIVIGGGDTGADCVGNSGATQCLAFHGRPDRSASTTRHTSTTPAASRSSRG